MMKKAVKQRLAATVAVLFGATAAASRPDQPVAAPGPPVVVELYQSQGCSSCPPANQLLNGLATRGDLIPLSFAVTYWDQLGWKDTFARPDFTKRQWDYAHANGRGIVATPQFVVEGRFIVSGSNPQALFSAIAQAKTQKPASTIDYAGGVVRIGPGRPARPASVWLVRYDPRTIEVSVGRGENEGRTLPHRDIVTGLWRLGSWDGSAASFKIPAAMAAGGAHAILVQEGTGGPIVAARRI
jgi:hypothetical protein